MAPTCACCCIAHLKTLLTNACSSRESNCTSCRYSNLIRQTEGIYRVFTAAGCPFVSKTDDDVCVVLRAYLHCSCSTCHHGSISFIMLGAVIMMTSHSPASSHTLHARTYTCSPCSYVRIPKLSPEVDAFLLQNPGGAKKVWIGHMERNARPLRTGRWKVRHPLLEMPVDASL